MASAGWTASIKRLQHDAMPGPIADPTIATAEAAGANEDMVFVDIGKPGVYLINKTFVKNHLNQPALLVCPVYGFASGALVGL